MSDYVWNRTSPDICECGFERKVHLNDRCPWEREELKAMQRSAMSEKERAKFQSKGDR